MFRYTHFESDDAASDFAADGHRVRYLGTGDCKATPVQIASEGLLEWIVVAAKWCCALLFFGGAELCRLVLRLVILVLGAFVLPLALELACIAGAVLMYPLGVVGRWLGTAVEHAGLALSERSLSLSAGRRVLGVFGELVRGERTKTLPLRAAASFPMVDDPSKSMALAVRCDRAEVER